MTPENIPLVLDAFKKRMDAFYHLADRLATLASGALALSVTFTRGTLPHSGFAVWCLRISWLGFLCTVAGFLLIHLAQIWIYQDFINKVRAEQPPPPTLTPPYYFHIGRYLLIIGFSTGLVFLALFGVLL